MNSQPTKIRLFDIFVSSLTSLEKEDKVLYDWPRNRTALTHALASHIQQSSSPENQGFVADMCPSFFNTRKILNPDILLHNRENNDRLLAVVCRNDYLTDEEQQALIELRRNSKCSLVLAVSFLPRKDYMLIYRVRLDKVEYYHFERETLTIEAVRKKQLELPNEDSDQLKLEMHRK